MMYMYIHTGCACIHSSFFLLFFFWGGLELLITLKIVVTCNLHIYAYIEKKWMEETKLHVIVGHVKGVILSKH